MIADLKPYPEYKESGLPWAERVPAHWEFRRTKVLFSERIEKGFPYEPLLAATQSKGVVRKSDYGERTVTASKDFHLLKLVEPGDFVISLRSFQGGLEIAHCRGIISPAYTILKPGKNTRRSYFKLFFKSPNFIDSLTLFVTGIREGQNIDYERLSRAYLPVPPVKEQDEIGRFLNHWNGRMEKTIRSKRRVIALLQEQKQTIINRAVTCGLDPNVKLTDSGSRWFPFLPNGWKPITLRRVITAAIDGPHFSPSYRDSGIPFLSARNVKADRWSLSNAKYISHDDYKVFCRRVRPEVNDVLYTKGGTTGVARAVDLEFPFQVWVHIAVLKIVQSRILPKYLAFCLNSPKCYEQSQLFTRGATNQDLGLGRMKEIELPLPASLDEQKWIVDALEKVCVDFDLVIARYEREINLLREYRTRLTADVVTGKLDVRAAAAMLPNQEEAPVPDEAEEVEEETETEDVDL